MDDLNTWSGVGRLTRDAELTYTSNGFAIMNFSIASNRSQKNGEQWEKKVSFFDIKILGKRAESLKQYLVKGKQVAIKGSLQQETWQSDGVHRSKIIIMCDALQLIGGERTEGQSPQASYAPPPLASYSPQPQASYAPQGSYSPTQGSYGSGADFPEDIPF